MSNNLLSEVLKSLFKKPCTVSYPLTKRDVGTMFRGKLLFFEERCIACGLCEKRCPSKCIKLLKDEKRIIIRLDTCLFCGLCVETCPVDAIHFTKEYELADDKKEGLFVD